MMVDCIMAAGHDGNFKNSFKRRVMVQFITERLVGGSISLAELNFNVR